MHIHFITLALGLAAGVAASPTHMASQEQSLTQIFAGLSEEQAAATCISCPSSCAKRGLFKRDMSEQEHQAAKDVLATQLAINGGKVVQTCIPFLCGCSQQMMQECNPKTMCCAPGNEGCRQPPCDPRFQCCFGSCGQPVPPPCDPRFGCCPPGDPSCGQQQGGGDY
ncbi:hypothetical protein GQ602_003294 [Ophiocordyceps camponoti-floridani]|uniref:Hydrophobin n=1 Tax=Ophiocordyceps camponoti-floridani TaxID=2030778 RepID=A0A8H4Q7Y2_9HYPO|nr:hypothetical protein GQ602_003294 [Ophiocordyceps camponoti-floridani]